MAKLASRLYQRHPLSNSCQDVAALALQEMGVYEPYMQGSKAENSA